jgi:hypothetical protein
VGQGTVDTIDKTSRASGVKALVSGSLDVASPIFPDVTRIVVSPRRRRLLPSTTAHGLG